MSDYVECIEFFKGTVVEAFWGNGKTALELFQMERNASYNPPTKKAGELVISLDRSKYDRDAAVVRFAELAPIRGVKYVDGHMYYTARTWYMLATKLDVENPPTSADNSSPQKENP